MTGKVGYFIWCPLDTIRVKGPDGKVGSQQNSCGPNKHVNMCLFNGCSCETMENRLEELEDGD